jgi:hypothetical protein
MSISGKSTSLVLSLSSVCLRVHTHITHPESVIDSIGASRQNTRARTHKPIMPPPHTNILQDGQEQPSSQMRYRTEAISHHEHHLESTQLRKLRMIGQQARFVTRVTETRPSPTLSLDLELRLASGTSSYAPFHVGRQTTTSPAMVKVQS